VLGSLAVAPFGNRLASFVDVGEEIDLEYRYDIDHDQPRGSIFLSIHYDRNGDLVLVKNHTAVSFQKFDNNQIAGLKYVSRAPVFQPKENHIYLLNITDTEDTKFMRVVKMHIIQNINNNGLMIRWNVLKDNKLGSDLACFTFADEPNNGGNNDHHHHNGKHYKAPSWVKGSIISLFVLFGVLALLVLASLYAVYKRRGGYERV